MLRDAYLDTREAYITGALHSVTAIAWLAKDRTFLAESELAHGPGNAPICAHHVVLGPWRRLQVERNVSMHHGVHAT